MKVEIPIVRTLEAIRRIGYTPITAILDILDNSIVAGASCIDVKLIEKPHPHKKLKTQVSDFIIIDNGKGMDRNKMYDALTIGSPGSEDEYAHNSLSKYGFGLKSAGLSQANTIVLLSKTKEASNWNKAILDWNTIKNTNEYIIIDDQELDEVEQSLIQDLNYDSGTIVRLTNILQLNEINPKILVRNLTEECSSTYHRFIEREQIIIRIDNVVIEAYDPLFLNEVMSLTTEYDGTLPCKYFNDPFELPLNTNTGTTMFLNAVQLPNPPLFKKEGKQQEVNRKYKMQLKNIGFYIYRNDRLISKGEKLGLVASDQDYMSFRASIDIGSDSDSDVNLDVSKSRVVFPDYAYESLQDRMNGVIKKSKELWNAMKVRNEPQETQSEKAHERSNTLLERTKPLIVDVEAGEIKPTEPVVKKEAEHIKEHYKPYKDFVELLKNKKKRIVTVDELPNSQLWKPGIDENNDCEVVVYISRLHPFYEHVYKKLEAGDDALVILDALFLNLSMAEISIVASDKKLDKMFEILRSTTSFQLSNFIEVNLDEAE